VTWAAGRSVEAAERLILLRWGEEGYIHHGVNHAEDTEAIDGESGEERANTGGAEHRSGSMGDEENSAEEKI
jgi:hypothetical protein